MKNIKRFEIDVETSFGEEDYEDSYPLTIHDLETDHADAMGDGSVAEITINGEEENQASFRLSLTDINSLFDVLNHIRNKVMETKPQSKIEDKQE